MFSCPPLYHKAYCHHSLFNSSYLLHHVFTKQGLTCNVGGIFGVSSNLALSLYKKSVLLFNNSDTSLKFDISSTFETFPEEEIKNITWIFFPMLFREVEGIRIRFYSCHKSKMVARILLKLFKKSLWEQVKVYFLIVTM